jgi:hypothetical protein
MRMNRVVRICVLVAALVVVLVIFRFYLGG